MNIKELLKKLIEQGFATKEEKEEVKTEVEKLPDEEKEEVKTEVEEVEKLPEEEVKPEEKPAEENVEDVDKKIQEAADKVITAINQKQAAIKKDADIEMKKKAMLEGGEKIEVNSVKHKMYTTLKGVDVFATMDEAKAIQKWFRALMMFKKTKQPNYFKDIEDGAAMCDKIAIHQKLEPINTVTSADGGFLVPTIMHNKIVPFLEDIAMIKKLAYTIDMTGIKTLDIPNIAQAAYVQWNSEMAQKATTSMVFAHQTLTPYILAGILVITQQMIDDAPFPMIQIVSKALAQAIATAEDAAFASGSGTGQPTGIDTYTPIGTVAAGAALTWQHFVQALYAMPQAYRWSTGLVWLMHRNNIQLAATLADTAGRPIFDNTNPMSNALANPRGGQILGIPIIENNDISEKTIYLVDLQQYWIGYSRQMSIDIATEATIGGVMDAAKGAGYYRAGHNLWERNELAVRAEEKIDGELVTTRALTTITATRP